MNIDVVRDGNQAMASLRKQCEISRLHLSGSATPGSEFTEEDGRRVLSEIKADRF